MLETALFDYFLPEELIARYPAEKRDGSKMMILDRISGIATPGVFPDIVNFLAPGDALIYNDTKVLKGRIETGLFKLPKLSAFSYTELRRECALPAAVGDEVWVTFCQGYYFKGLLHVLEDF